MCERQKYQNCCCFFRVKMSSAPILHLFIFADSTVGTDEILAGEKKNQVNSLEVS